MLRRALILHCLCLSAVVLFGSPFGCSEDCTTNCSNTCNQNCQCASQILTVDGCFNRCSPETALEKCGPGGGPCVSGACIPTGPEACQSDIECVVDGGGAGARCIDGACLAAADLCVDATQCASNESCVAGGCVPACSATAGCAKGYSCDLTHGVCTGNPTPCSTAVGGARCAADVACVEEHCVPYCDVSHTCSTGLVCVKQGGGWAGNGCVPPESINSVCSGDGIRDSCPVGSICLRQACYVACDPEAAASCATPNAPLCKPVTTPSGTYYVCSSSTNLGTECDPTRSPPLDCPTGKVCIDGYCR